MGRGRAGPRRPGPAVLSADEVARAARYFRQRAAADQRLIDRFDTATVPLQHGVDELERQRDLRIQLADEAVAYLPRELVAALGDPPSCSQTLF
jgi:hypothetical protein